MGSQNIYCSLPDRSCIWIWWVLVACKLTWYIRKSSHEAAVDILVKNELWMSPTVSDTWLTPHYCSSASIPLAVGGFFFPLCETQAQSCGLQKDTRASIDTVGSSNYHWTIPLNILNFRNLTWSLPALRTTLQCSQFRKDSETHLIYAVQRNKTKRLL